MFFKRRSLLKQVNVFNKLLYLEKSPENYIEEVDKLLRRFSLKKKTY